MNAADQSNESHLLGEMPPILLAERNRQPDRRQVSVRWLTSSILVGLTSVFLMGGALYAALDGRQELAYPAAAYKPDSTETATSLFGVGAVTSPPVWTVTVTVWKTIPLVLAALRPIPAG